MIRSKSQLDFTFSKKNIRFKTNESIDSRKNLKLRKFENDDFDKNFEMGQFEGSLEFVKNGENGVLKDFVKSYKNKEFIGFKENEKNNGKNKNSENENILKTSKFLKSEVSIDFGKNSKIQKSTEILNFENNVKKTINVCNHLTFQDISLAEEWGGNLNKFSRASSVNSFECFRVNFDKENNREVINLLREEDDKLFKQVDDIQDLLVNLKNN